MLDPSADDNCAVKVAACCGHLAVVERLLQDERFDPSADNNGAVREASQNGHVEIVDRLLQDVRVDPSADDNAAIRWAVESGHLAVVDRLLQDTRIYSTIDLLAERINHIGMIRTRCTEVSNALQDLNLPALLTLEILDELIPNDIRMWAKWELVTAVKHFHQRQEKN